MSYAIDASVGLTVGRMGHAAIALLALALALLAPALVVVTLRLWSWLRPVAMHR